MPTQIEPLLEETIEVDASPARVWSLVSDLRRMANWSTQVKKTFVRGGGHCQRCEKSGSRDVPRSDRGKRGPESEEHHGNGPAVAAAQSHRPPGNPLERPVRLGKGEEQRDAGQGEKKLTGKAVHDRARRHSAEVHAHDPGERDRQYPDVESADAAHDHCDRERAYGNYREVHGSAAGETRRALVEKGGDSLVEIRTRVAVRDEVVVFSAGESPASGDAVQRFFRRSKRDGRM